MMVCRMLVRSKVFVCAGVLAFILMAAGLAYVMVSSPYERQLKALRQTCAALTRNDPDGRVYEAIVGRYLGSKSQSMMVPSVSSWMSHEMVFLTLEGQVSVYSGANGDAIEPYFVTLKNVLGRETIDRKQDTTETFGLCVYLDKNRKYVGKVDTLKKIKED